MENDFSLSPNKKVCPCHCTTPEAGYPIWVFWRKLKWQVSWIRFGRLCTFEQTYWEVVHDFWSQNLKFLGPGGESTCTVYNSTPEHSRRTVCFLNFKHTKIETVAFNLHSKNVSNQKVRIMSATTFNKATTRLRNFYNSGMVKAEMRIWYTLSSSISFD